MIKPVAYELEGLLKTLRDQLLRADKGYLVESFWKFLLYTELAKSVYDQLLAKPAYYKPTVVEAALCEFIEQHKSLIAPEFSSRLESAVLSLQGLHNELTRDGQRLKISELLHSEMLGRLRVLLGNVFEGKAKVTVLVDNLDKAWNPNGDLLLLSELLFGLLSAARRISEYFERNASGRARVNLSFALFLRSDIFAAMLKFAKERDKLPSRRISWEDSELLKQVIEERFMKSGAGIVRPDELWDRYFVPAVKGLPTWEYITACILPKPRDLIYFVKSALQFSVNRGKTRIEASDLDDGAKQYSRFALSSLIVEAAAKLPRIEDLMVQFVGSSEVITERDIADRLAAAKILDADPESVTNLFLQLTFIGPEIGPNRFRFMHDEQDETKLSAMSRKVADETTGGIRRFLVHRAFHAFLEIQPHAAGTPGQMTIAL